MLRCLTAVGRGRPQRLNRNVTLKEKRKRKGKGRIISRIGGARLGGKNPRRAGFCGKPPVSAPAFVENRRSGASAFVENARPARQSLWKTDPRTADDRWSFLRWGGKPRSFIRRGGACPSRGGIAVRGIAGRASPAPTGLRAPAAIASLPQKGGGPRLGGGGFLTLPSFGETLSHLR